MEEITNGTKFEQLSGVQNILVTLFENIYNDDTYQDYLKELENDTSNTAAKKLTNINQVAGNLNVFNNVSKPLFIAKDIGILIGASNVLLMIKDYNKDEKVTGYIDGSKKEQVFLTDYGVYRLLLSYKSKLADVFRKLIYKLIDYMQHEETQKYKMLINELANENKELIAESMNELNENVIKYKQLYSEERKKRLEIEDEKVELEGECNFNEMYINQLKIEKTSVMERLTNKYQDATLDETNLALEKLKHKFMKEFTISIVNPKILDESFATRIKEEDLFYSEYKYHFDYLSESPDAVIECNHSEMYYVMLTLISPLAKAEKAEKPEKPVSKTLAKLSKKTIPKEDFLEFKEPEKVVGDYVQIASEFVIDKNSFSELIDILKSEVVCYAFKPKIKSSTNFVFKTTVEYIKLITRNLIIDA